jgi:hypothetical protein
MTKANTRETAGATGVVVALEHVWSIQTKLQVEGRTRDIAMFNLAIDSKLRGCDVRGQCLRRLQPRLRLRGDGNGVVTLLKV